MLVKTKKGITICTLFDNETITIKAIKIANENKDNAMINKLAGDELSSIDYLMGYYTKNQIEDKHFKNFIENIDYGKRSNSYKRLTIE